ncbi:MAG: homoserine dehydrogenase [Candidatus Omnitrophota bacterium]|nr:homoserine dehydrogenase [Candidatus Omnitrophota bacterium]
MKINIGLIGLGNVGVGVVKILNEKRLQLKDRIGIEFVIKKICDKDIKRKRLIKIDKSLLTTNYNKILEDKDIDIVIELIGGIHPAKEVILKALFQGKNVVTANKALLAQEGLEIFKQAKKYRKNVYFEASVGAGIPIIKTIQEGLVANKFKGIFGIINGTSNFVLSKMLQEECTFKAALEEAKKRGFAERNASLDIEGYDSAHKLIILTYLAFGKFVKLSDIFVEGISSISLSDVRYARQLGMVIKLLAIAKATEGELEVRVHPTLISKNHLLSSVNGIFNAIYLNTDFAGDILLYGEGAGQMSAASAVVSDIVSVAQKLTCEPEASKGILPEKIFIKKLKKIDQIETRFYIRFMAIDRPGVLSKISGILGKFGISISSVTQAERRRSSVVPVVMLTHDAKERNMRLALEQIYKLAVIREKPVAIRMERI